MQNLEYMEYTQYPAASTTRWRDDEIGSWYMRIVKGAMGMDKGISQHWMATQQYTQFDLLKACQEWQSGFIGKSLEHLSDMNKSATNSLLRESTQNHETLLWFKCMDQPYLWYSYIYAERGR